MLSNNEQKKEVVKKIKDCAKKEGYKCRDYLIFKIIKDNFVFASFGFGYGKITNNKMFNYSICIKKYSYDDIFWDVINMSSNKSEPDSLRAIGAFSAPSIIIKTEYISGIEAANMPPNYFVDIVTKCSLDFIEKYDVNDYILNTEAAREIYNIRFNEDTIKCLAYIDTNRINKAVEFAENMAANNKSGYKPMGCINEGKNFFEWLIINKDKIYSIYGK